MLSKGLKELDIIRLLVKKIASLFATLIVVSLITFLAFQVIPGDSVLISLGTNATEEAIDQRREELGLNENVFVRYFKWLGKAFKGEFGVSSQYHISVSSLLGERIPITIWLTVISTFLVILISIPLGILASNKVDGWIDRMVSFITQVTMAIPPFFLGIIITLVFGFTLRLFTPGRFYYPKESFNKFISFMIFPSFAIAIPKIAMVVKFLRSSILRQLDTDYVRTAKSKGLTKASIMYSHVLKNALIPVVTFIAMVITDILANSIIIEQVFGIPGLGRLLVISISNRDYAVVQAIVIYIVTIIVVLNFIVDILYQYLDPRVRIS